MRPVELNYLRVLNDFDFADDGGAMQASAG
jgi:hypothetical protein